MQVDVEPALSLPPECGVEGQPKRMATAYEVTVATLVCVLVAAAYLKWQDPTLRIASRRIVPAVELSMAVWLVSGLGRIWARRAALSMLLAFTVVGAREFAAGQASCGCFGAARVHPGWTLAFDVAMATALFSLGRGEVLSPHRPPPASAPRLAVAVMLGLAFGAAVQGRQSATPADDATRVVVRQVQVGGPFPILASLPANERIDLASGRRTVVVYDPTCEHCRSYVASLSGDPTSVRLVDVAIDSPIPDWANRFRQVRLPSTVDWILDVPLRVELVAGRVEAAWRPR